jgi:hypothetical protein
MGPAVQFHACECMNLIRLLFLRLHQSRLSVSTIFILKNRPRNLLSATCLIDIPAFMFRDSFGPRD